MSPRDRPLRVLYFGTYSTGEGYPRNRVLIEGLRRAGAVVEECHADLWRDAGEKSGAKGGAALARLGPRLLRAWALLAARYLRSGPHDVVVVGYTGQADVFPARALAGLTGRPVVLDAFLSLYDTAVSDRGLAREGGVAARLLRFLDRASSRAADLVLLDTRAHARYFERLTGLPAGRFADVPVGEDDRVFPPVPPPPRRGALRVLWFGTFVPLQGAEVVLGAAERLAGEPVRFRMVGRGQRLPELRARAEALPNLDLVPRWVPPEELHTEIAAADVCLGIFGTGAKARRVIPCKVYDALSVGRAVVTADTPGARELLRDGESAVLVRPGDPDDLARGVRRLMEDEGLRLRVAEGGRRLFAERASPDAVGRKLLGLLGRLGCRDRAS